MRTLYLVLILILPYFTWAQSNYQIIFKNNSYQQFIKRPKIQFKDSISAKRYLFDYEDIGQLDRAMKQIIPFWMWASRALPLHLTNMIVNPKPYQVYRSFERNFKVQDDIDLTPDWIELAGGFKITSGTYLMPDLGFNRIPETLGQFGDPARLLTNVNPIVRVPLELATNKQFYNNREFSDKPKDVLFEFNKKTSDPNYSEFNFLTSYSDTTGLGFKTNKILFDKEACRASNISVKLLLFTSFFISLFKYISIFSN